MNDDEQHERFAAIASEVDLADSFAIRIGHDTSFYDEHGNPAGRFFYQIQCWRKDVITGEMGYGYGGKYYLTPHAANSELIQTIWGAYQAYWLHEARETFKWRGRRIFGPHISAEALYDAAPHVDIRSARHIEDEPTTTDLVNDALQGLANESQRQLRASFDPEEARAQVSRQIEGYEDA